ncbi:MAG: serine/threonine-protein kinase [Acidimicrobiales bacterium]
MVRTKHRIGGYRVIAPIGAGGFATVYRALDEKTGREVAIKVLAENHSLVPDTRRRFVDEVGLLQTVDSPTIAKIYEVGETEAGQPYMVLELADRGDLRRRLEEIRANDEVLKRADLTMLAHHLYDSLTTLHRAEIVHRDVSPGNILIRTRRTPGQRSSSRNGGITLLEPGERFLLADLGHAKDLIQASGFTAGGGTRGFASPEQRDDITVVDLRADIFSATAIIEWAAHDGEFAEGLEPFFDIGLASEPEDRFTSMTEWHNSFSAALGTGGPAVGTGFLSLNGLNDYMDTVAERFDRRALAVAAAALVLGGAAAYAVTNRLDDNSTVAGTSSEAGQESQFESVRVVVTSNEIRDTLQVVGNANQLDGTAGVPAPGGQPDDANDQATTTETATTETVASTAPEPETTVTTAATTGTVDGDPAPTGPTSVVEGDPEIPLLASVDSPKDGVTVDGDLEITGSATFPTEMGSVEISIRNLATRQHWNHDSGQFEDSFHSFTIPVEGGNDDGSWTYVVPDERIDFGPYSIRVWAKAADGKDNSVSDAHSIVVS